MGQRLMANNQLERGVDGRSPVIDARVGSDGREGRGKEKLGQEESVEVGAGGGGSSGFVVVAAGCKDSKYAEARTTANRARLAIT